MTTKFYSNRQDSSGKVFLLETQDLSSLDVSLSNRGISGAETCIRRSWRAQHQRQRRRQILITSPSVSVPCAPLSPRNPPRSTPRPDSKLSPAAGLVYVIARASCRKDRSKECYRTYRRLGYRSFLTPEWIWRTSWNNNSRFI